MGRDLEWKSKLWREQRCNLGLGCGSYHFRCWISACSLFLATSSLDVIHTRIYSTARRRIVEFYLAFKQLTIWCSSVHCYSVLTILELSSMSFLLQDLNSVWFAHVPHWSLSSRRLCFYIWSILHNRSTHSVTMYQKDPNQCFSIYAKCVEIICHLHMTIVINTSGKRPQNRFIFLEIALFLLFPPV